MDVGTSLAGSVEGSLYEVLLEGRAGAVGVSVELQQALRQLPVGQTVLVEHSMNDFAAGALGHQVIDTLAVEHGACIVECREEGE